VRILPVIDLEGGAVVHAVRGERGRYRPVRTCLSRDRDPLSVARAFRAQLGLDELYVADLQAIVGGPPQREEIAALARETRVLVDAGVSDVAGVRALLALGCAGVVIGTETLADLMALRLIRAEWPEAALVVSLDMRDGRILARDRGLAALGPLEAMAVLTDAGAHTVIVLDLGRVGTAGGADLALVAALSARFPEVELLAGGGVRDAEDLRALAAAGAAGALVATALHSGAIGRAQLSELGAGRG
jgi:HisA/HisF family protein